MSYCTVCRIEYEEGRKFCRECGKQLSGPSVNPDVGWHCPSCGALYGGDKKFCKTCGVPLVGLQGQGAVQGSKVASFPQSQYLEPAPVSSVEMDPGVLSGRRLRSYLKEKAILRKKINKYKGLIGNLEGQRKHISEEALSAALRPYQIQMDTLEGQVKEIDAFLENLQKRLNQEVEALSKEELPYGKHCSELKTMKKVKGLTFGDYRQLKKEPARESKRLKKQIRIRQDILKILKSSSSGRKLPPSSFYWKTAVIILAIALFFVGGYLGYRHYYKPTEQKKSEASPTLESAIPPVTGSGAALSAEEEIKKVFETIKRAMETRDINLYMSGFSAAFPGFEDKKKQTLQTWEENEINDIRFNLRDLITQNDTAEVTVVWSFTSKRKKGGKSEPLTSETSATLQKEAGQWKIVNIK